ncbi:MAG: hypothetical protein AB7I34_11510 [Rhizobiaceae bacterium]
MPLPSASWQAMLFGGLRRSALIVLFAAALAGGNGYAQEQPEAFPNAPTITGFAPAAPTTPLATSQITPVRLAAKMTDESAEISRGMIWRVFGPDAGPDGKLPLVASAQGGIGVFELAPGRYLVHAAFGRAGATKRITVGRDAQREELVLEAGGLELNALLPDGKPVPPDKLRFSIYEDKTDASGDRPLVVPDVKAKTVVRLNAGVYHVVSNYGAVNATVRSDIRVEAGKLTQATVEHKAAQVTLKLVREKGGEALAETSWSVVTDSGDPILETVGPYATVVLAEGSYTIVAKNRDRIFQAEAVVESGKDAEVEVVADPDAAIDPNEGAD